MDATDLAPNPVVVVPAYRAQLNQYEAVSLRHLCAHLSHHRIVMVKPSSLAPWRADFEYESFDDAFFGGRLGYNRLMLSADFYERFRAHSHILVYQLDALVFRDDLIEWCQAGFDYVGASWYPELIERYEGFRWRYAAEGCGNGGFSLRRVDAFLRHLRGRRGVAAQAYAELVRGDPARAALLWKYRRQLRPDRYEAHESLNEDVYWGIFAPFFDPSFKVASAQDGDRFAFEYAPAELYRKTGGSLPFGCHAWYKFEDAREFYRPFLLA